MSIKKQARKPQSYASPKLCPAPRSLTGVKCSATSVANNKKVFNNNNKMSGPAWIWWSYIVEQLNLSAKWKDPMFFKDMSRLKIELKRRRVSPTREISGFSLAPHVSISNRITICWASGTTFWLGFVLCVLIFVFGHSFIVHKSVKGLRKGFNPSF